MNYTLGERLKELVKEKGMEQQEVAIEIGLKVPTFNGYISNKREPSIHKLILFARYFKVSIDYLLGYSNIRDPYLSHLPEEIREFIMDPENSVYLKLAKEMKDNRKVELGKKA